MNIKKTIATTFALTMLVVGLLVTNSFGQTRTEPRITATFFGMHSLAAGQTARLTVVNSLLDVAAGDPCNRVGINFDIYAADPTAPNRLRFVRRVSREVDLEPGDAVSFNFPASRTGNYISVSTFARRINESDPPEPIRTVAVSTLEIREGTRTLFTSPGVIRGFDPQPDPPSN